MDGISHLNYARLYCQVTLEAIPGHRTTKALSLWSPDTTSVPFTARLSAETPAQFDVTPTSVSHVLSYA